MVSKAQINGELLRKELAKESPDPDILYALKMTEPYWNTVDTDRIAQGLKKLRSKPPTKELKERI